MASNIDKGDIATRWRNKISSSHILHRLVQYSEGRIDMEPARAMVGLKLIDKILPSLKQIEVNNTHDISKLAKYELDARMIALGHNPKHVWQSIDQPKVIDVVEAEPVEDESVAEKSEVVE